VGNCQLNVGVDDLAPWGSALGVRLQVRAGEEVRTAARVEHAGGLGPGSVGLSVDPYGMLALVLERRSAAEELLLGVGDAVVLRPLGDDDGGPAVTTPIAMSPRR
jgi:hypothetical protein